MEISYIAILNNMLQGFTHGTGFVGAVLIWVWIFHKKEPKV